MYYVEMQMIISWAACKVLGQKHRLDNTSGTSAFIGVATRIARKDKSNTSQAILSKCCAYDQTSEVTEFSDLQMIRLQRTSGIKQTQIRDESGNCHPQGNAIEPDEWPKRQGRSMCRRRR